jgi:hypothetical protein
MKRLAVVLIFLSVPVSAQNASVETVTAYGNSLAGVWHGDLLQYGIWSGFFSFFSAPKLQGVAEAFCRIGPQQDALEMSCLQGWRSAPVTTDGTHVHFGRSRGDGASFDGELLSATQLNGHFQIRRWGIAHENPAVADASRVKPDPAAPDKAGRATLLRRILGEGLANVPHDNDAMKKNGVTDFPKLGAVQSVAYLGQKTKWDNPQPGTKLDLDHLQLDDFPHRPDFFSVYDVLFDNGELLCGLHQRDDGALDAFQCV